LFTRSAFGEGRRETLGTRLAFPLRKALQVEKKKYLNGDFFFFLATKMKDKDPFETPAEVNYI